MSAAIGQALNSSRNPCWFMWPITQSITTPQMLLLNHYQKVNHGNHPVPDLSSEGVSPLEESGFISLVSSSALSCNAGSHSRCLQAEQNAEDCLSLAVWQRGIWFHKSFPSLISLLPNSLTTLQKAKLELGSDCFGPDGVLLHVQWQAERWEHIHKCHKVTGVSDGAVANSQYL